MQAHIDDKFKIKQDRLFIQEVRDLLNKEPVFSLQQQSEGIPATDWSKSEQTKRIIPDHAFFRSASDLNFHSPFGDCPAFYSEDHALCFSSIVNSKQKGSSFKF